MVVCLNNSVDYKKFAEISEIDQQVKKDIGLEPDSFVFGTIGRLVPTKGLSYLLRAFAKVNKQIPNSKLIIAGKGRLESQLRSEVAAEGLDGVVHFLGYINDVEKLMHAMNVFVLTSIAEGMPGVILEAMAAGTICVATKVGGIPQVLENGKLGILVEAKCQDRLAEIMLKLARQPNADHSQMIHAAKEKVMNHYDHCKVAKMLEEIYETA